MCCLLRAALRGHWIPPTVVFKPFFFSILPSPSFTVLHRLPVSRMTQMSFVSWNQLEPSMWELVKLSQLSCPFQCSLSRSYLPVTSPTSEIQFAIPFLLSFVLTSWYPSVSRISCWGRLIDSSGNMAAELQTKSGCLRSSRLGLAFVIRMYKRHYLETYGQTLLPHLSPTSSIWEKKP